MKAKEAKLKELPPRDQASVVSKTTGFAFADAAGVLETQRNTSAAAADYAARQGKMGTQSLRGGLKTRRVFKKKRLMSRKYCKKTPCRRMGFTQKASCRPYKNCYTRRRQR
jgi:hypothetical protein